MKNAVIYFNHEPLSQICWIYVTNNACLARGIGKKWSHRVKVDTGKLTYKRIVSSIIYYLMPPLQFPKKQKTLPGKLHSRENAKIGPKTFAGRTSYARGLEMNLITIKIAGACLVRSLN